MRWFHWAFVAAVLGVLGLMLFAAPGDSTLRAAVEAQYPDQWVVATRTRKAWGSDSTRIFQRYVLLPSFGTVEAKQRDAELSVSPPDYGNRNGLLLVLGILVVALPFQLHSSRRRKRQQDE
jgi:hypothetical protein